MVSGIHGDTGGFPENLAESQRKALTRMNVRMKKHAAKLAEWSERVQACRSSGLSVKEWCERNNVCSKTYYTWERVCLAEVSKQLSIPTEQPAPTGQLVRINPDQLPDEVEVSAPASSALARSNVKITLRYGGMSVEMPAGMDIGQIAVLMKALG